MPIRYLTRCFSALLKMSLARLWAYRADFWMSLLLSVITLSPTIQISPARIRRIDRPAFP